MDRVPVVIVGGGPVGLVAALELARYGIRSLVVERHDSTRWHSKPRNLNTRTMEIARGWGRAVHDELAAVNLPRPWTGHIIYTRTPAGENLGRMPTAGFTGPDFSPEVPRDAKVPLVWRPALAARLHALRGPAQRRAYAPWLYSTSATARVRAGSPMRTRPRVQ